MKELPPKTAPSSSSGGTSAGAKIVGIIALALIAFFGYFIAKEYFDKTPVYGKHGWDEIAGPSVPWEEAAKYCNSRRKRLPDREELKTFSKRADSKLKQSGIYWSTSPEGDKGNYYTVNLSNGEFGTSPTGSKFATICVK